MFANDRGCTDPAVTHRPTAASPPRHRLDQHRTHRHHHSPWPAAPGDRLAEKGWMHHSNTTATPNESHHHHLDHGQPRTNTFHRGCYATAKTTTTSRLTPELEPTLAHHRSHRARTSHNGRGFNHRIQPFGAAGVCPRRCGPSPLEQSNRHCATIDGMDWGRARRCRHDSTATRTGALGEVDEHLDEVRRLSRMVCRWPARLVICVGSPSPARLSRLLGASGSAGRPRPATVTDDLQRRWALRCAWASLESPWAPCRVWPRRRPDPSAPDGCGCCSNESTSWSVRSV